MGARLILCSAVLCGNAEAARWLNACMAAGQQLQANLISCKADLQQLVQHSMKQSLHPPGLQSSQGSAAGIGNQLTVCRAQSSASEH